MSTALILAGSALVASPFVIMTVFMIQENGWVEALKVWGVVFAIWAAIVVGSLLVLAGAQV